MKKKHTYRIVLLLVFIGIILLFIPMGKYYDCAGGDACETKFFQLIDVFYGIMPGSYQDLNPPPGSSLVIPSN
jgi:hypothetical protein